MYLLIVPASAPFILLATVLGLSWREDRILPSPPTEPAEALIANPSAQQPLPSSQNSPVTTPR